jgi:hypothetical protein
MLIIAEEVILALFPLVCLLDVAVGGPTTQQILAGKLKHEAVTLVIQ